MGFKTDNEVKDIDQESIPTIHEVHRGGRKSLYLAGIIAAGGGFVVGFDTGAISGIMVLEPFQDRFLNVDSTYRQALLVAMMLLTATIGGLASGNVCDTIGRKYTILLGTWVFAIGALFETIGYNFGLLMAGRLLVGFGEGFLTNAIPLYHTEIAPPDIRGRLITLFSATASLGTIVGFFVNFGTSYLTSDWSWRAPFLIQVGICVLLSVVYFMPFSPRWLIDKGRKEEALVVLAKLHESTIDDPEVKNEFKSICEEIETERSFGDRTFVECFRGTNMKRTLLGLFAGNGAAFTGTYSISYYTPQIFQQAGLNDTAISLATSGASNVLVLIFTILTMMYVDKVGRRLVFASGAFIMGASMYIVGGLFQGYNTIGEDGSIGLANSNARNCVIALVFIFQAAYAYSWGPVAYIYPAEISNMRTRAKVIALAYGINWAIGIFMTFIMPIFMDNTIYGGYYFFGACCTVLFLGSLFIPETKGKTLEEIDRIFNPM
ncbi:general substrate transporter [Rhizopus microsporus var. microsporus]|uniref:General substrate transporter n=2 Tax=Rhizopus microsporus TaxID=58291 RepID=A0A2G4SG19_RHIZD|nr:general substrate transporter [Rhizopus microsporus ATCC 52813]ORE03439.1 general substrate transporter [Rhizopus microsporus var. microsporus]PHZ07714.1 general substrate transporter [Rhizopus microsporus ATCC 52813]